MSNSIASLQPIKSVLFAKVLLGLVITGVLSIGCYILLYYAALFSLIQISTADLVFIRQSAFTFLPFVLVIILFFLVLWVYTLYVDMYTRYEKFSFHPGQTIWYVAMPVIHFYGFAKSITRIIGFLDEETKELRIHELNMGLKYSLSFFYMGVVGLLVSLFLSFSLPGSPENMFDLPILIFTSLQFLLFGFLAFGLIWLLLSGIKLIRYIEKKEDKQ